MINEGLVIPTQVNIFDHVKSNVEQCSVDVEDFIYLSFIVLVFSTQIADAECAYLLIEIFCW